MKRYEKKYLDSNGREIELAGRKEKKKRKDVNGTDSITGYYVDVDRRNEHGMRESPRTRRAKPSRKDRGTIPLANVNTSRCCPRQFHQTINFSSRPDLIKIQLGYC